MAEKMQIVRGSMKQYGKGWTWKIELRDTYTDDVKVTEYRTNEAGTGLWAVGSYTGPDASRYQDNQLRGTCQFSLCNRTREQARRIIRRHFAER